MGLFMGFQCLGGVWVGVWVVGFRSGGCDFFRWVGGFVPMGLMVGFNICSVCLVVGFSEDDDDEEEELVRTDGFGMNKDGDRRWQK